MKRVEIAKTMLEVLNTDALVVTGDEKWVYFENHPVGTWELEELPRKVPKRGLTNKKLMILVFFSRHGLQLFTKFERGQSVTSETFCEKLTLLKESLSVRRPVSGMSKIVFHFDNARPHTAKDTKNFLTEENMTIMPHPPYSPDLAPCDYFLFGYLTSKLRGCKFSSEEEAFEASKKICSTLPKKTFQEAIMNWSERLQKCIDNGGEYVE